MSLYYEAAPFLDENPKVTGPLKARVYGDKGLKSKANHIYALISNATAWADILGQVIQRSELLKSERKLTPSLALLLVHDLLLSKDGVAAPSKHVLRLAINRHRARLNAEFTKARLKAGFASLEEWSAHVRTAAAQEAASTNSSARQNGLYGRPRWIRVNTIKSSVDKEMETTFAGYECLSDLGQISKAAPASRFYHIDDHIPNLIALPPSADLSKSQSYRDGNIIFQDKASCFPAYLLDPSTNDTGYIDACAAPGNKTTHLAALLLNCWSSSLDTIPQIWACERDKTRSLLLQKMVHQAGASEYVTCLPGQDFLSLNPFDRKWSFVDALLLDPSCSGSGIVGREDFEYEGDTETITSHHGPKDGQNGVLNKMKRKRDEPSESPIQMTSGSYPTAATKLNIRLKSLSNFQTRLLTHAMKFPSARKIVYSTCSIHAEENEHVVFRALRAKMVGDKNWRILRREEQVDGMRRWPVRGLPDACSSYPEIKAENENDSSAHATNQHLRLVQEACIRCEKGTEAGTMGFFIAAFVRNSRTSEVEREKGPDPQENDPDEEWEGFNDGK